MIVAAQESHSQRVLGLNPPALWNLHVLPMLAWVLSGSSGFLSQSKNMQGFRLTGNFKLGVGAALALG